MPSGRRMSETEEQRIAMFQRLAEQRLESSYRLANIILRDESQSQDAVHDAVVVAWQRWGSLRDRLKFDAWFDRIVVNVCKNRLRDGRVRRSGDMASEPLPATPDPSPSIHQRLLLEQAFDRLKPDDVVVLALRHFLDLELDDIALLLDVPLATAKTRLRSARIRLRKLLDEQSADQLSR